MRRFAFFLVSALIMSGTTFAGEKSSATKHALLNWRVNTEKLSECLQLRADQYNQMELISEYLSGQLASAAQKKDDTKRAESVRYAVNTNLKLMKQILTHEQFRKYVVLLNMTFYNKGLDVYLDR